MFSNVRGRVHNTNLPKSQGLLPLFEAIVNSIDAIEDVMGDKVPEGRIDIKILRLATLDGGDAAKGEQIFRAPIYGFEVLDNGIGFDESHFLAFNEADTQYNVHRGGKGIGRFLWLKAFEKVEIDSIFKQDKKMMRRSFVFSLVGDDGISNHKISEVDITNKESTSIRLLGLDSDYEKSIPHNPNILAERIVEHCLKYFVLTRMPLVGLRDRSEQIELDVVYDNLVQNNEHETIKIKEHLFDVVHFMLQAHSEIKHHVSYCADRRVVLSEKLGNKIPNLPASLKGTDNQGDFVYAGYVSSDYLDQHVNSERTGFQTPPEEGFVLPGELSWQEIEVAVLLSSRRRLAPFTENERTKKEERIREYVNDSAPEYRHILKNYPEHLDVIPPDISDEKLDSELHDINRQIEGELKQEGDEILQSGVVTDSEISYDEQLDRFSKWWEEYNDFGKSALAKYIVHRKMILTFLAQALRRQNTGKYSREEVIHRMIFPLKRTSDDISYDQHNLWVIDEKLAYHQYLSSDLRLREVEAIDSDSSLRPDLLCFFDRAIAMVDAEPPFSSGVVIFEFKRPMRDDYTDEENPVAQVLRYVKEIRGGTAVAKDGRPIQVPARTPFYCYIICDLTQELSNQATFAGLLTTPDNMGYFGYNGELAAYIEVIAFDKLVGDANKRNRILFEKLNLPGSLPTI